MMILERPSGPFIDLTLRDWFAGQALIGLISIHRPSANPPEEDQLALDAYVMADAMLSEREKK